MDFIGEVTADFLGITDSKYQFAVDTYNRQVEELERERQIAKEAEEEAAKVNAFSLSMMPFCFGDSYVYTPFSYTF